MDIAAAPAANTGSGLHQLLIFVIIHPSYDHFNCRLPHVTAGKAAGWDGAVAIAACIGACVAAYGVYLGLPLILGALADTFHFDNRQIGWLGGVENLGLLLGSIVASRRAPAARFRQHILVGMAIAVSADGLTLMLGSFPAFCLVRFTAGLGGGLCYSSAIATLSLTRQASRNFMVFVVVLVLANSLELWLIPGIVRGWGVAGLYISLALLYVPPALLMRKLPATIRRADDLGSTPSVEPASPISQFRRLALVCLAAVVLFNVAASAFYAFAERIGLSVGLAETAVAKVLTLANLLSLTGSLLAYGLSRRWGQHRPQLAAIGVMIGVYLAWSAGITSTSYTIGVVIFFAVWSMASVYQLSTLTGLDRAGSYVALVPAAQGLGQSFGPFLAGLLLGWQLRFPQMLLCITVFAGGCFAAYLYVYLRLWQTRPDLANT